MSYRPTKAVHPGKAVARALDDMGKTQKWLAAHAGISEKQVSEIINGKAPITPETALRFKNTLGGSARFWINLDSNYRETVARLAAAEKAREEIPLLRLYPVAALVKLGFVEAVRNKTGQVLALQQFFGVSSLTLVQKTEAVAYRRWSGGGKTNPDALAAWLRCGELEAGKTRRSPFNANDLRAKLPELRALSSTSSPDIAKHIANVLAECGVAFAAIPHFKGTYANGACRWIGNTPVVQLSLRGKHVDTFFFTLFHELGHILKHLGAKRKFILDDLEILDCETKEEREANRFACDTLIPAEEWRDFFSEGDYSPVSVQRFARKIGINPAIVAGRVRYETNNYRILSQNVGYDLVRKAFFQEYYR